MPGRNTEQPLRKILESSQELWDAQGVRPAVRANFHKVLECRSAKLGSEVYASEHELKVVHHTCKSRACPSCGRRATLTWQRELMAALPDIPYTDIVFTMPDHLWPIFRENRHLLQDLAALGGRVIEEWAKQRCGVSVFIMVIRHTSGRDLKFNPHLHILVSSGGLDERELQWIPEIKFDEKMLMVRWKWALISYLREVLTAGRLISSRSDTEMRRLLTKQYERWWNIKVSPYKSKNAYLGYAGRYLRRPPVAQHRFRKVTKEQIHFATKDSKLKREVLTVRTIDDFVKALADQVPDHYRHSVRYFGLLAPRTKARTRDLVFRLLGQEPLPRPKPLSWAYSIEKAFGKNPLQDAYGQRMRLIARRSPC